jgi:NADH-quinone oxidoreductase subunit L
MFLAMGVGAFTGGIFHLMTHAFFKACLFLGSGSVIHGMHHAYHHAHLDDDPQDMRNMGGLRKKMPITFWTFMFSTLAIAGFPLLSGFFSKDEILWWSFASTRGSWMLWVAGAVAAGMTAFYMFRLVSMTFFGEQKTDSRAKDHIPESPWTITLPLVVLAVLAVIGGFVGVPEVLGGHNAIHHYFEPVFGESSKTYRIAIKAAFAQDHSLELLLMSGSVLIGLGGIGLALFMYLKRPDLPGKFTAKFSGLHKAVYNKWYIDELYDFLFVNPTKRCGLFLWRGFDVCIVDGVVNGIGRVTTLVSSGLRYTQTGLTQHYAMWMVIGVVMVVGFYIFG